MDDSAAEKRNETGINKLMVLPCIINSQVSYNTFR